MNYYLIGGSGGSNFGDELMMNSWLAFLHGDVQREGGAPRVVVDNNSANGSRRMFGTRYPCVEFVSALKAVKIDDGRGVASFQAHLHHGLTFFSQRRWAQSPGLGRAVEQLREADLLHLYGGGYINTWNAGRGAFLIGVLAAAVREFDVPAVATGIGITPLNIKPHDPDAATLVQAIDAFELFEVRSRKAAQQLRALGVGESTLLAGLDDVFLDPVRIAQAPPARRLHLSAYRHDAIFDLPAVQAWLHDHVGAFDEVCYWTGWLHSERELIAQLQQRLPAMRVLAMEDLVFNGLPVAAGDHMLTMRYHPHLMAARAGAMGEFHSNSTYYHHKHGEVVALGGAFTQLGETPREPGWDADLTAMPQRDARRVARKRALARRLYGLD